MTVERARRHVYGDTYVLVNRHDQVLLVLRGDNIYRSGEWGLPSGQGHPTETYLATATRKLRDEVGLVVVTPLRFVHMLERLTVNGDSWVAAFFAVDVDALTPVNNERDKHDAVAFFPVDALPHNLSDYIGHTIDAIGNGERFSEFHES